MFDRPMLSWIWLTAKSKFLDLTCLLDPRYLRFDGWPSSSTRGLTCLLGPHYLIPLVMQMEDGHFLGCVKGEWSFLWVCPRKDVWEDGYYLELIGLPSKCLGSDMFVKPILPWTWLTAKPMYFSLACLSNPRYLGLGGLPCLIALGLACLPDPRYLGFG
jgi:hypothetical protein